MEPVLMILAVTYICTGKYKRDTDVTAYKSGKEPPGLVKARMRHEAGGGRFITRPGKPDKPKGPGATRLLIASRWSVVCTKAKKRGEDKLRRWEAWFDEQAPNRDKAWCDKQRRKIDKRRARLEKWKSRWTGAKDAAKNAVSRGDPNTDSPQNDAVLSDPDGQQPGPNQGGDLPSTTETPLGTVSRDLSSAEANQQTDTWAEANVNTTNTPTGELMDYEQAATALRAAAERIEQYRTELSAMADGLGGRRWGEEVHGPLRDMDGDLHEIAADYRDLAAQMQQQGDNVSDAEDAHPYVPGEQVVNA